MTEMFDAVVIGGGPAGSAAAYTLAARNLRTCLIDKSDFPREKLCGGLVTERSKDTFESVFSRKWDEQLFVSTKSIAFYAGNKHLGSPTTTENTLYFTMRREFDAYLLKLAREAGATAKLNTRVTNLDIKNDKIELEGGEVVKYRYLIGADGVNSQVAKELFGASFDQDKIGFGLEVEVPRESLPDQPQLAEIDFSATDWGYGWIFPKKRTFTIGVGGLQKQNPDIKSRLSEYLLLKGLDIANYKVKGQFIPFGDFRKSPGINNVLLCGDAAGLVDPITGEGIAYAMQSGYAAGNAIYQASSSNQFGEVLGIYLKSYAKITEQIKQARRWRYLIFPKIVQRPFRWAFADAGTLRRGYLQILAGKLSYNDLYKLFIVQVAKAIRKAFRYALRKLTRRSEGD